MDDMTKKYQKAVNTMLDSSFDKYGTYGYGCGYLNSVAVDMFRCLSKRDQLKFLTTMTDAVEVIKESEVVEL